METYKRAELDTETLQKMSSGLYAVLGQHRTMEIGYELGMEDEYCEGCETETPHFIHDEDDGISECFVCGNLNLKE